MSHFEKIKKSIESCKTIDQIYVCEKSIDVFSNSIKNDHLRDVFCSVLHEYIDQKKTDLQGEGLSGEFIFK